MIKQLLVITLSGLMIFVSLTPPVSAAVISTEQVLTMEDRQARIAGIQASLARADVQSAMIELGVDPAQAQARVHALTDEELLQLEGKLETLPAGGDGVLVLIGAVFLVLLILELTGAINIFHGP
jgi:hypothetical protein